MPKGHLLDVCSGVYGGKETSVEPNCLPTQSPQALSQYYPTDACPHAVYHLSSSTTARCIITTSRTGSPSPCPAATAEPPSGTHRKLASRFSRTPLHQETGSQQPSRTKDLLLHTSSQPRVFLITTGIASTKIKHASCGEARPWT